MTKRMPEDEAIDFTFTLGVDTAFRVAQSMSEESTLKKEDVPQVAQAIQEAVEKAKKKNIEKAAEKLPAPTPQPAADQVEIPKPNPDNPNPEDPHPEDPKKSIEKQPEPVGTGTQPPGTAKSEAGKASKAEPKVKVKKGRQRLSITVIEIKPHFSEAKPPIVEDVEELKERENIGWEVQVRITAADITTIVFNVERQKPVNETVQALANEIVKSDLVPENRRENIEKYLNEIISRLLSGKLTNKDTDEKPTVKWNGCRRLEDGNMEIEVDINSVRHVPPLTVKYTMQKLQSSINTIKTQGVILESEVSSVTKALYDILEDNLKKMGSKDEMDKFGTLPQTIGKVHDDVGLDLFNLTPDGQKMITIDITPKKSELKPKKIEYEKIDTIEEDEKKNIKSEILKVDITADDKLLYDHSSPETSKNNTLLSAEELPKEPEVILPTTKVKGRFQIKEVIKPVQKTEPVKEDKPVKIEKVEDLRN